MNYFLKIMSTPEYPVRFCKSNPQVDNNIDLGKFVDMSNLTGPLRYFLPKEAGIAFDTLSKSDVIPSLSGGVLISERLKTLIESNFPHQVQMIAAEVEHNASITAGFYALNIYTKVACYNLEKSVYEVSPVDSSYEFERCVLIDGPLEEYGVEYQIVRCIYDNKIVVSDTFKNLMEANLINSLQYESEFIMEW